MTSKVIQRDQGASKIINYQLFKIRLLVILGIFCP